MSNGAVPTVTSIEMSPMASSVGRREIGLRSTEVGYDEERADSSASSGFATMSLSLPQYAYLGDEKYNKSCRSSLSAFLWQTVELFSYKSHTTLIGR